MVAVSPAGPPPITIRSYMGHLVICESFTGSFGYVTPSHHHLSEIARALDHIMGMLQQFSVTHLEASQTLFLGFNPYSSRFTWEDFPIIHIGQEMLFIQLVANLVGKRLGGNIAHLVRNGTGAHVKCAAEDTREAQRVVHHVRKVRPPGRHDTDRKSTRLNSSHQLISYAV